MFLESRVVLDLKKGENAHLRTKFNITTPERFVNIRAER